MAVPKFDALILPLLKISGDGKEHRLNDVVPDIANNLGLSGADRAEQIPSGQSRLRNRIYWAKLYLSQARAIDTIGPGVFRITDRGRELLSRNPTRITPDVLMEFPEFVAFRAKSKGSSTSETAPSSTPAAVETGETPQESIQTAYLEIKAAVVRELLDAVRAAHWTFLESLIVKLLIAMGYGDEDSGIVLGGVHDGGVDGVVRKDRLGLSSIYIQAKRYKDGSSVGAPAIEQFAGSMDRHRSEEGVFVTTSTFTKDARDYVGQIHKRIALIDGQRLAELMFELGIGVTTESVLTLKRIDSDFFAEE
jgi:restriction system protein